MKLGDLLKCIYHGEIINLIIWNADHNSCIHAEGYKNELLEEYSDYIVDEDSLRSWEELGGTSIDIDVHKEENNHE